MPRHPSSLLSLPEAVMREVFSWCPDGATASALLKTCNVSRQMRHDPTAAALLLVRCPCRNYHKALARSSNVCKGGAPAVAQQVLQLLGAGPECGGPYVVPPALLEAMLLSAAAEGDSDTIHALQALPHAPDVNSNDGRVVAAAWDNGPHLAALHALVACGADVRANHMYVIRQAASLPDHIATLEWLLQRCPSADRCAAQTAGLMAAIHARNFPAVEHLLMVTDSLPDNALPRAAQRGSLEVLQLLLNFRVHERDVLSRALISAATYSHAACAELLLALGADVNFLFRNETALYCAVKESSATGHIKQVSLQARKDTVVLLLQAGARVTPRVLAAEKKAKGKGILLLLVQHAVDEHS